MGRRRRFHMFLQDFQQGFLKMDNEKLGKVFRWIIIYYMTNEEPDTNGDSFLWDMVKTDLDKQDEYSKVHLSTLKTIKNNKASKVHLSTPSTLLSYPIQSNQENTKKKYIKKDSVRFVKPSSDEVSEYANSLGFILDGGQFVDFYESKGWLIGKTKMKDWKAAVRTWKRNNKDSSPEKNMLKFNSL